LKAVFARGNVGFLLERLRIASLDQHAVRLHYLAHPLVGRGYPRLAAIVAAVSKILTGVEIAPGAQIAPGLTIVHGVGLVIGEYSVIGPDCTIYQGVTLGTRYDIPTGAHFDPLAIEPRLGARVIIYAGAKIFGPVSIGDDAVIAANAVVLDDVPAGKLAVGAPAKIRDLRPNPYSLPK
jgi:serine O-acetyltransferase